MTNKERAQALIGEIEDKLMEDEHGISRGQIETLDKAEKDITAALDKAEVRGIAKHAIR